MIDFYALGSWGERCWRMADYVRGPAAPRRATAAGGASVAYAQEVLALLRTAKGLLAPDGVLFLLEPLFAPGQSRAARFLVSKDRGQNIRTEEAYAALCGREFLTVRTHVDASPLRIPYTGIVITC